MSENAKRLSSGVPQNVKENKRKRVVFEADNVDIVVGSYNIEVEGKGLEKRIIEELGVEDYEDYIRVRGKISLVVEAYDKKVEIRSDFKVDKKEEEKDE
ncbi:MAG: hypothetical protein AWU54_1235 [Candidatus Frackibacter sp. T328-2]|nr:MAG: hypothetical protein AWU54_1235 [Candidatus Frackibacter sp. T328-2]